MARAEGSVGLRAPASAFAAAAPARYFERLSEDFGAAAEGEVHQREIAVAGRRVRLRFADNGTLEAFYPALSHLAVPAHWQADLEFCIWDAAGAARPAPEIVWGNQDPVDGAVIRHLCDDTVRTKLERESTAVLCYDRSRRRVLCCTRDVAAVPWEVRSSPFVTAFGWALSTPSMPLVHAGCVGQDGRGALIVGPSGSGKSTTCLAAAVAGLEYVSDDYLLIDTDTQPVAHSLTCMGRLHRSDMGRIAGVDRAIAGWIEQEDPKAAIDMRRLAPDRIRSSLPATALLLPRLAAGRATVTRRVGAAEALRVMAPSSLFLLPPDNPREAFAGMASLARVLPAYILDLGGDPGSSAREVERLCGDE